ncbi:phage baseplate plug family protein [Rhizobium sp.]|uniref:phage baseplate plug family protein n=1 Tax=Rhizobium sp. TaxID=391 RepID=UPI003F812E00
MLIVPLQAIPNQTVTVTLNGQVCQIDVYQTVGGLFVDLYVSNTLIIGGVIAETNNRIVRSAYLGFSGDLAFVENVNDSGDPYYTGLGTTWSLAYLFPDELTA